MLVDKCKVEYLVMDSDTKIKQGDWLKSKGESWHMVLNIKDSGYTQHTLGYSNQSFNYKKAKQIVCIYTGYHLNDIDIEEVYKLYIQIYQPNKTKVEIELLESFNKFI